MLSIMKKYPRYKQKKYDNMKNIRKDMSNKRSVIVRKIVELIIRGHSQRSYCSKLGINYHLYRYYLLNYNKELMIRLSKVRRMRRDYQHEHTMRRELYKIECKDAYKKRRERKLWYKLL